MTFLRAMRSPEQGASEGVQAVTFNSEPLLATLEPSLSPSESAAPLAEVPWLLLFDVLLAPL